jgi:hypothetical protein
MEGCPDCSSCRGWRAEIYIYILFCLAETLNIYHKTQVKYWCLLNKCCTINYICSYRQPIWVSWKFDIFLYLCNTMCFHGQQFVQTGNLLYTSISLQWWISVCTAVQTINHVLTEFSFCNCVLFHKSLDMHISWYRVGRNIAAGMTSVLAYILDEDDTLVQRFASFEHLVYILCSMSLGFWLFNHQLASLLWKIVT